LRGIIPFFVIAIVLLIAVITDMRFQKIPNWLTYPSIIIGMIYHTGIRGHDGLFFSIGGAGVGILVLSFFYLMGGIGAGDVKLMGAVGGFLGPKGTFIAFLFTSIVGGIYSLMLMVLHGYLKQAAVKYGAIIKTLAFPRKMVYIPSPKREEKPRLRYGIAIALGSLISVVLRLNI